MAEIKDGGPAFPIYTPDMNVGTDAGPGMSLRDWFAGQSLSGLIVLATEAAKVGGRGDKPLPLTIAVAAYELADAMLAERERDHG